MSKEASQSVAESTSVDFGPLLGRFDFALDPKKRLTIPSGWRDVFVSGVVYVMPDRKEKCLNLYPKAEMDSFFGQLRQKALLDPALNRVYAKIGAVSQQLLFDVQGRIRISDKLLQFANLTTTVAMVGAFRMVKLYAPEVLGPADDVSVESLGEIDEALTAAGL